MSSTIAAAVFLLVVIVISAVTPLASIAQSINNAQILSPCTIAKVKEKLLCGKLEVFEDRTARTGRKIKLNVIVVPAIDFNTKQTLIFFLDGGPGIGATQNAKFFAEEDTDYRRSRDIVLVDQRGTGDSNPLNCSPIKPSPEYFLDEMYPVEYVRRCRSALESAADLTKYTTEIAMDDLDDVRKWLGYQKVNLWGLSYGTRAAQAFMRRHPDHVQSVVLSGALSNDHHIPFHHARDGQRGMDLLLDSCVADAACKSAFPNIIQELRDLIVSLRRSPTSVKYVESKSKVEHSVRITADVFAEFLRSRLYTAASSRAIPFIIHQAFAGDFSPFLERLIPENNKIPADFAEGLYLSITCTEDVPFINVAQAKNESEKTIFGSYRVTQQTRACGEWRRGKISAGFHSPLVSKIPTLIISGFRDPITPPSLGRSIARHLSQSRQIVLPFGSHVEEGLTHLECHDNLILTFFNAPDVRNIDASCVNDMRPQHFVVKK